MKKRLEELIAADSCDNYAAAVFEEFGLSVEKHYDVLVVAPAWKPTKIMNTYDVEITCTCEHAYCSGYEVKGADFLLAWVQTSTGASSIIDEVSLCAALDFDKLVFVGAVGSLVSEIGVGSLCTPSWCISGNLANGYLQEDLAAYKPFGKVYPNDANFVDAVMNLAKKRGYDMKTAPVFCTDSIFGEYSHMDFIKSFGVSLIEMETSTFYLMADLMEKPAIALFSVSDNSATGVPLLLRSEDQKASYKKCCTEVIPLLIMEIAKMNT
ncbi:MAG: hypothetical protein E7277_05845 [Lachnospiraceae bacterium]|nr:hypothetical protein [Lachnospiraceae bacterium]